MSLLTEDQGLKLIFLGGFNAYLDGCPVAGFTYNKMRALLGYLAMEREQDHQREVLAELLWPDHNPTIARNNLRRTLADLRRVLETPAGTDLFEAGKHTIRFVPNGYVDVLDFLEPLSMGGEVDYRREERIIALYRGEFLAGLSLPESQGFESWLQIQRESLHCRAISLLDRLSTGYERIGDYGKALQYALRHTQLAPWDEDGHRRAMRFYALNGQTGLAIQQYDMCCRHLKSELDVLPSEETRHLAERIRNGELRHNVPETPLRPVLLSQPAERRQVTVLYCALTFADIEDPDDLLERLNAPQARCIEIIRQFSGHIVQTHGGGLLAYFGFPHADENAAIRAVQAALAITGEAENDAGIRVGVHTGLIIADADAPVMDLAGKTSTLAMQLRKCAGYGEVVISPDTHLIVAGYFDCVCLGPQSLPDFARPVNVFKVLRESGARTRLDAATQLTPLVGRKAEIDELMALWKKAESGLQHVVLIQGEAGVGKSRLLHIIKQRLAGSPHVIRELRCFPEFSQSPFHPLIAMFEANLGFASDDAPAARFGKVVRYVDGHYQQSREDAVPALAKLLSLPAEYYQLSDFSPQKQKELTCTILIDTLKRLSAQQPVLLVVEDLHWADPSTLELLTILVEQKQGGAILAAFTTRPEFVPPWDRSFSSILEVEPLTDSEVAELIALLNKDIPAETVNRIVERTDGIPLFAEEITKMVDLSDQADIPATLRDLLAARLDKMGEAKQIAQLAATLGREFNLNVLGNVCSVGAFQLKYSLRRLQDAGLVLGISDTLFQFKHALIQEAAYQSQTKAGRQAAHRRIAQVLLADRPDIVEKQAEVIARHLDSAGEFRQAIDYWLRAAQRAPLHSYNVEAVEYLESGLKALESLPAGIDRDRLEFALQVRLGPALQTTQGFGSASALQAFYRAVELSQKIGNTPGLFQAQIGLCIGISSHPDFGNTEGLSLCLQLLSIAQESANPQMLQQAHHVLGNTLFWMGRFTESGFHQRQAIALDPISDQDVKADDSGRVTGVTSQAFLSWVLWFQGFPEQAQQVSRLALKRARQFGHANTLGFVLTFASALQRWSGDVSASLAFAEEGILFAQKKDLLIWQVTNSMQQGWVLSMQGNSEGVAQIRQCVDNMRVVMGGVIISFSAPFAEALLHHGQIAEALDVLDEALTEGDKKNDHHFEAELHRLKGECLTALCRHDKAEACFNRALAVSREQGAKSLELRAATSMARLWLGQGRQAEAKTLLEDVYGGFTEEVDNPDLRQAAELIGRIAG
ncbi:AAA family ATPase [Candidatus Methylobacter oryzae]|uniref:AAA family ATPase n=1 Tax=Candidatus Methylobacter oryzae TaxID=2497749 RepID=A0ABY3CBQ5_9GAMM|nr:AAA family ATPase [Candidatus Methylobacter oryzae]TRW96964.1 AAA family ATPase [Candidatus Methylobacter oryzae]